MAYVERKSTNMNKRKLADALADRMGLPRSVAYEAVENVFDICAVTLAEGTTVSITNFASMEPVTRKPRMARNPANGERIQVPSHKAIRFNVSRTLTAFANSEDPSRTTIRKRGKGPVRQKPLSLDIVQDAVEAESSKSGEPVR